MLVRESQIEVPRRQPPSLSPLPASIRFSYYGFQSHGIESHGIESHGIESHGIRHRH
jgi:hypothetical protein